MRCVCGRFACFCMGMLHSVFVWKVQASNNGDDHRLRQTGVDVRVPLHAEKQRLALDVRCELEWEAQ